MKTKITTLLMVLIFFLSASSFADDPPSRPSTAPSNIYIGPADVKDNSDRSLFPDNYSILVRVVRDYIRPTPWVNKEEGQPEIK